MITIDYIYVETNHSTPRSKNLLYEEFLRIKNIKSNRYVIADELPLIFEIIENLPLPEVLSEFIFSKNKYNILIKHEALIKSINSNQIEIVEYVALHSNNHELVKTAIYFISNDILLQQIVTEMNDRISPTHRPSLIKLALRKIKDENIFTETVLDIYSIKEYYLEFKRIKFKSSYRNLSDFQIRIIPIILQQLNDIDIIKEFSNASKYPRSIINLITAPNAI